MKLKFADVIEATEFLVQCHQCKVEGSEIAFKRIFQLIWSHNAEIRRKVVEAFQTVHLSVPEGYEEQTGR